MKRTQPAIVSKDRQSSGKGQVGKPDVGTTIHDTDGEDEEDDENQSDSSDDDDDDDDDDDEDVGKGPLEG